MRLTLALVLMAAALQPVSAQQPAPPSSATPVVARVPSWFSFGFGPSIQTPQGQNRINLGVRLSVPLGIGAGVVDVGGTVVTEPISISPFSSQSESMSEVHAAAGAVGRLGGLVTQVAAGPAFVQVSAFETGAGRRRLARRAYPGLYASAQAVSAVSRTVGIGAEAFGVLNAGQSTGGLRLFVAVGALR